MKTTVRLSIVSKVNLLLLLLFALSYQVTNPASAANTAAEPGKKLSMPTLNKDSIRAKIEALNKRQGLDESLKTNVLNLYQSTEDN
ncbi:MAG: hypothetical protein ABL925_13850, partial [Methylococcales bacterium]